MPCRASSRRCRQPPRRLWVGCDLRVCPQRRDAHGEASRSLEPSCTRHPWLERARVLRWEGKWLTCGGRCALHPSAPPTHSLGAAAASDCALHTFMFSPHGEAQHATPMSRSGFLNPTRRHPGAHSGAGACGCRVIACLGQRQWRSSGSVSPFQAVAPRFEWGCRLNIPGFGASAGLHHTTRASIMLRHAAGRAMAAATANSRVGTTNLPAVQEALTRGLRSPTASCSQSGTCHSQCPAGTAHTARMAIQARRLCASSPRSGRQRATDCPSLQARVTVCESLTHSHSRVASGGKRPVCVGWLTFAPGWGESSGGTRRGGGAAGRGAGGGSIP